MSGSTSPALSEYREGDWVSTGQGTHPCHSPGVNKHAVPLSTSWDSQLVPFGDKGVGGSTNSLISKDKRRVGA